MKKRIIRITAVTLAMLALANQTTITSEAIGSYAKHEKTPEEAMHVFDNKPDGLGYIESIQWNEANDMHEECGLEVWHKRDLYAWDVVTYVTNGEQTREGQYNLLSEHIKKGTVTIVDKGIVVDPNNRTATAKIDETVTPQDMLGNEIQLTNITATFSMDDDGKKQDIPCIEITADKPCYIEVQVNSAIAEDDTSLIRNSVLFCPTDLYQPIVKHTEYNNKPYNPEIVFISTSDAYIKNNDNQFNGRYNLNSPEEAASCTQALGNGVTHFTLAEGKNYIYYNSYCNTINNFVIKTVDGSNSIKLDCVTRYVTK